MLDKKYWYRMVWGLCILTATIPLHAQTHEALQRAIEPVIYYDAEVLFEETPAFIIGVIVGDSTYVFPYGSTDADSVVLPTDSTIFEIGGASKVFTACLVETLVQKELLSYDTPLYTYFDEDTFGHKKSPTLEQLLSHTGGYPRRPTGFGLREQAVENPFAFYTKTDLWSYCKKYSPSIATPSYMYSNTGYALLELALEQHFQAPFEKILQKHLLQPLRLADSYLQDTTRTPTQGYARTRQAVGTWQSPAFGACVGVKTSLRDLLGLLRMQLDTVIFENTHRVRHKTNLDKNSFVGLGWHIIRPKKYYDVVVHSGSTAGHRMFMGFVKETRTAVVVLSNSKKGTKGLGYRLLKILNGQFKKKR